MNDTVTNDTAQHLAELAAVATDVAIRHTRLVDALAKREEAAIAVLARAVELAKPALPALVQWIPRFRDRDRYLFFDERAVGLYRHDGMVPIGRDGRTIYRAMALLLLECGQFAHLSAVGHTPVHWKAKCYYLTRAEVVKQYEVETVVEKIAGAIRGNERNDVELTGALADIERFSAALAAVPTANPTGTGTGTT